jgi:hypothetical protein
MEKCCSNSSSGSNNYEAIDNESIQDDDLDELDALMISIANNKQLSVSRKCLQYLMALQKFVVNKGGKARAIPQFKFDISVNKKGELRYTLKNEKTFWSRYGKYLPTLVGPIIGAGFGAVLRTTLAHNHT